MPYRSEIKNSFDLMRDKHRYMPRISDRFRIFWIVVYWYKALWWRVRCRKVVTKLLGYKYTRSRTLIEIDITYQCNLKCFQCNRSVRQAPEYLDLPVAAIDDFVSDSIRRSIQWKRIRVLGGEPTLHPAFLQIIDTLSRYRDHHPECMIEVVSNGYGETVKKILAALPDWVLIDNSYKSDNYQATFRAFNYAPVDDILFKRADFANGCDVLRDCGMALTPLGYYPCAVAGGIDRIMGKGLGLRSIPNQDDDMRTILSKSCRYCGRFRDGLFIPRILRAPVDPELMSPAWTTLYSQWRGR